MKKRKETFENNKNNSITKYTKTHLTKEQIKYLLEKHTVYWIYDKFGLETVLSKEFQDAVYELGSDVDKQFLESLKASKQNQ